MLHVGKMHISIDKNQRYLCIIFIHNLLHLVHDQKIDGKYMDDFDADR